MPVFDKHKPDSNQTEIIKALQKMGATVDLIRWPTDLVVGYRNLSVMVEIKPIGKIRFSNKQKRWWSAEHAGWREIVQTKADCYDLLRRMGEYARQRDNRNSGGMPNDA